MNKSKKITLSTSRTLLINQQRLKNKKLYLLKEIEVNSKQN
jgi:hypothetical protein